jgi:protein associated with RNAse G/E
MVEKELVDINDYKINQRLYRYVEIEKLISMLIKNVLPLSRMTLFDDPYEGSYPRKFLESQREIVKIQPTLGTHFS